VLHITQADNALEASWRDGRWETFVRLWLTIIVGLAIGSFIVPFVCTYVGGTLINVIVWIFGGKGLTFTAYDVFDFSWRFGAFAGAFALVGTVPAMALKSLRRADQ
jgi:hypothetical protein